MPSKRIAGEIASITKPAHSSIEPRSSGQCDNF
jgi:hypothetical protein